MAVTVDGGRELRRALKELGDGSEKDLRRAYKEKIADPVAADVKAGVPRGPGRPPGHWYTQIRSGATQRGAYVQWGRTLVYPPILEFAEKWGGVPGEGRYVYPVVEAYRDRSERVTWEVLDVAARRAGLRLQRR